MYSLYLRTANLKLSHREAYNILARSIQTLGDPLSASPTIPNPSPVVGPGPDILSASLYEENYPNIRFWHRKTWIESKSQEPTKLNNQVGMHGKTRISSGENVTLGYVEDENGNSIDGYRVSQITSLTREIWMHLRNKGLAPEAWSKGSLPVHNYYRSEMYKRFPELRLCEGHWKADFIATNSYSGWYRTHVKITNDKHERTCKTEDGYGEQCAEGETSNQVPQKRVSTGTSTIAKKKFKIPEVPQLQNDAVKPTKKAPSIAIPRPSTQTSTNTNLVSETVPGSSTFIFLICFGIRLMQAPLSRPSCFNIRSCNTDALC